MPYTAKFSIRICQKVSIHFPEQERWQYFQLQVTAGFTLIGSYQDFLIDMDKPYSQNLITKECNLTNYYNNYIV